MSTYEIRRLTCNTRLSQAIELQDKTINYHLKRTKLQDYTIELLYQTTNLPHQTIGKDHVIVTYPLVV